MSSIGNRSVRWWILAIPDKKLSNYLSKYFIVILTFCFSDKVNWFWELIVVIEPEDFFFIRWWDALCSVVKRARFEGRELSSTSEETFFLKSLFNRTVEWMDLELSCFRDRADGSVLSNIVRLVSIDSCWPFLRIVTFTLLVKMPWTLESARESRSKIGESADELIRCSSSWTERYRDDLRLELFQLEGEDVDE